MGCMNDGMGNSVVPSALWLLLLPHYTIRCSLPMWVLRSIVGLVCNSKKLFVVVPESVKVELVVVVEPFHLSLAQSGEVLPSEILC